jgi:hypothetical protein
MNVGGGAGVVALAIGVLAGACSSADPSARCGTGVLLGGNDGSAWAYGGVAAGGAIWFDPGDAWTPDDGSDVGGADNGDGTGGAGGDNGSSGDTGGGDTGGGDTGGDGSDAMRVRLATAVPSAAGDASGCYGCVMVCGVDGSANRAPVTHAARGISATSTYAACMDAVRTLEQWAHLSEDRRLVQCARVADASSPLGVSLRNRDR